MTNEAVIIELLRGGVPVQYTCAEAVGILKGTLMEMSGDKTVIANTNANACFAGILATEKVGGDGSTTCTVWTNGIFDILTDAGVDVRGAVMVLSNTENELETGAAADLLNGSKVGYLLETSLGNVVDAVRVLK